MGDKAGMKHSIQATRPIIGNEEIFKAEKIHRLWLESRRLAGYHLPSFHISAFSVAPPLGPDGKTYCPNCDTSMVPWVQASTEIRDARLRKAREHMAIQRAWEELQL